MGYLFCLSRQLERCPAFRDNRKNCNKIKSLVCIHRGYSQGNFLASREGLVTHLSLVSSTAPFSTRPTPHQSAPQHGSPARIIPISQLHSMVLQQDAASMVAFSSGQFCSMVLDIHPGPLVSNLLLWDSQ